MKLFWSSRSPFVRKVMIVIHELGIADEVTLIRTVVHPARPNGDVMKFNPLSKIPTLVVDDELVLCDSRVICDYLDAGRGRFIPPEGCDRWRVLTWQAMADGVMETALLRLAETAKPENVREDDLLAGCTLKISGTLDRFERDDVFLAASEPTLGHIAVASALLYLDFRFSNEGWRQGRPRLQIWFDAFAARPSVAATGFADVY